MNPDKKLLCSTRTTKLKLDCGHTKLYQLIADGKLKAVKLGGSTMITQESIDRLLASLPVVEIRKPKAGKAAA